jgi:hypothetical protein
MKKLFAEKPLIHFTFVLTVVALVCGLVIGGVNAITAPIIEENIYRAKLKAYQEVVPDLVSFEEVALAEGAAKSLLGKVEVFDKELDDPTKTTIAFIYEVLQTNKFGQMRFVISVDATGRILGASFITLEQTYKQDATDRNLQRFVGMNLNSLGTPTDLESGATGSLNTLRAMLADVANEFVNSIPEPEFEDEIDQLFQAFTSQSNDTNFASQATATVLSRQLVVAVNGGQTLGYIYKLQGTSEYQTSEEPYSSGSIAVYVIVDVNHNILKINLPFDEYNHTSLNNPNNFYYKHVTDYAALFIGRNISDSSYSSPDLTAGPSNSKQLFLDLMEDLKEVLQP